MEVMLKIDHSQELIYYQIFYYFFKFLLISLTCFSFNLIIVSFFKALLIPCEIPVDNPAKLIVLAILGNAGLIILKAVVKRAPIPSPGRIFNLFLESVSLYLIFPF